MFNNQKILKILREEDTDIQKNVRNLVKTKGIYFASSVVGGFKNVVKILNLDVTDIETQEMLVKNFINYAELEDVEISFLEVNRNRPDKVRIKIYFKTNLMASNMESWIIGTLRDEINKFFPFNSMASYEPAFAGRSATVVLDAEKIEESDEENIQENLESKWNTGNYDYQHGFCHYFAYNIIGKIRKRFPNKKVNYYLLLANEVERDTEEIMQEYLLHVYIKIDDMLLDSNGVTSIDKVGKRIEDWYDRQLTMIPEDYELNVWEEESDEIPEMFFNNKFCNVGRVRQDLEHFLSNPIVKRILRDK
jgi:hypothetical protein